MQATQPFQNNYDLAHAAGPPYIQIVDWFYMSNPANSTQGSNHQLRPTGYAIIMSTLDAAELDRSLPHEDAEVVVLQRSELCCCSSSWLSMLS